MNPYSDLPQNAFWKHGVENASPFALKDLYRRRFTISPTDRIATAGSCFAQHISRYMNTSGYAVMNLEPSPGGLPQAVAQRFGYAMYSARYGNIYTLVQLLQLLREVSGTLVPAPEDIAWQRPDGRYIDAFRPNVEPEGLESVEEVLHHRAYHLARVKKLFLEMDVFIFTMGLTETWEVMRNGLCYPSAPGVFAGTYDASAHRFRNLGFSDNLAAFEAFHTELASLRNGRPLRYILTVSPVPLTATASGHHVLSATSYSKSVLRAVAGTLKDQMPELDYFPSYEIITNQSAKSVFYENNLRSVRPDGVETVMKVFFSQHPRITPSSTTTPPAPGDEDVQCEDVVLEAFSK